MRICYLALATNIHTERFLKYFVKAGHDVHILSFHKGGIEGVTYHHIESPFKNNYLSFIVHVKKVKRILKEIDPDVVHGIYLTNYCLLGALVGIKPFIATALGSDALLGPKRSIILRYIVKYVLKKADMVTSMAGHMTEELVKLGVERDKIFETPIGVDTSIFNPASRQKRDAKLRIISTRNFEPIYNLGLLLDAIAYVKQRKNGFECILVGDGSRKNELMERSNKLKICDIVKYTGYVPNEKVAEYLASSDVFVTTSSSDGSNISLLEAMARGVFPIATDIPANRQWIDHCVNGYLVPADKPEILGKKIILALEDKYLREKARKINWKIIKDRASWQLNMKEIESKYERLAGKYNYV